MRTLTSTGRVIWCHRRPCSFRTGWPSFRRAWTILLATFRIASVIGRIIGVLNPADLPVYLD
jgi:hypothetical protein